MKKINKKKGTNESRRRKKSYNVITTCLDMDAKTMTFRYQNGTVLSVYMSYVVRCRKRREWNFESTTQHAVVFHCLFFHPFDLCWYLVGLPFSINLRTCTRVQSVATNNKNKWNYQLDNSNNCVKIEKKTTRTTSQPPPFCALL